MTLRPFARSHSHSTMFRLGPLLSLLLVLTAGCDGLPPQPVSPELGLTPASIAFGAVIVGQTLDRDITISTASGSTATLDGSSSVSGSGFSIVTGGGAFSLSPNQSRTVTVRFAPGSATSYSGTVTITHNATNTGTPISVALTGTGANVITITVAPSSVAFGAVTVGQTLDRDKIGRAHV